MAGACADAGGAVACPSDVLVEDSPDGAGAEAAAADSVVGEDPVPDVSVGVELALAGCSAVVAAAEPLEESATGATPEPAARA